MASRQATLDSNFIEIGEAHKRAGPGRSFLSPNRPLRDLECSKASELEVDGESVRRHNERSLVDRLERSSQKLSEF
jgi:hypothetical protein